MGKRTALYDCHLKAQAKMVDFAGWDMPIHYGSQIQEHRAVREKAGIFDVSHMTIVDVKGPDASSFLQYLLANNIQKLSNGKALYTCMLNEAGGVIDDLIVYQVEETFYRLIVNSATHDKDIAWLALHGKEYDLSLTERTEYAMVAIQGPETTEHLAQLFSVAETADILNLKPFHAESFGEYFIARTGYTGEDGFEIILPKKDAPAFWDKALASGIVACGLGARDTLRLEAGLNLYGADMDEKVTPLESNLTWTLAFEPQERHFIGRQALEAQLKAGLQKKLVGLILEGQGVLRNHQTVIVEGIGQGEITSGSFSPTLNKGIALARLPYASAKTCVVEIRGKTFPASIIQPPFVKKSLTQKAGHPKIGKLMEQE